MTRNTKPETLGDRMKAIESIETDQRFLPNSFVYARLDGRSFSRLTEDCGEPFDKDFAELMVSTAMDLVKQFNALTAFVQSDEISLVWYNDYYSPMIFNGKKQKLVSSLAARASSYFTKYMDDVQGIDPSEFPTFDCRVMNVPNEIEASNQMLWRAQDAKKNSISMLATYHFNQEELHGKNSKERIDMLKTKRDVFWDDEESIFKYGTFVKKDIQDHTDVDGNDYQRTTIVTKSFDFSSGDYDTKDRIAIVTSSNSSTLKGIW